MKKRGLGMLTPVRRVLELKPEPDNIVYYPVTGGNILFDKSTGAVIGCDWYVTEANIPEKIEGVPVTSIGNYAFQCPICRLVSVRIPNTVTSIGNCAFYCCDSLTSVWIPDSVTTIGSTAFYCCDSLTCLIIPKSVTSIGNAAFQGCSSLIDVYYDGTQTEYEENLFPKIDKNNKEFLSATLHFKEANTPPLNPPLPGLERGNHKALHGTIFLFLTALTLTAWAFSRRKNDKQTN